MGFHMSNFFLLSDEGFLSNKHTKILDIGSQNLYHATPECIKEFVTRHGKDGPNHYEFKKEAERISYFSWVRPGERTSYISELLDLTSFFYTSYDVCPALKTEIFDLNCEQLPPHYNGAFDVVLNFGTTEHILNQLNCFKLMHHAVVLNGVIFHQLPSIGWVDHGYFTYHPKFFIDLANANGFKIHSMYYTVAQEFSFSPIVEEFRDPVNLRNRIRIDRIVNQQSYNLNVLLVKTKQQPFRLPLELETSHSAVDENINRKYA